MSWIRNVVIATTVLAWSGAGLAQTSTTPGPGAAGDVRPARGPDQASVPSAAPPASTTQPTAAANPEPGVQQMNDLEKQRVQREGK